MKYYTVGEFAKLIGKNPQTLREWDKKDVLKPHHVAPTVITVFSRRLQGRRANKAKKMIKELLEDDNVNESSIRA